MRLAALPLALVALVLLLVPASAPAQEPAPEPAQEQMVAPTVPGEAPDALPAGLTAAQIGRFIDTLEDEGQRERFIENLRVLSGIEEDATRAPPVETTFERVAQAVSGRLDVVFGQILALGGALGGLPDIWQWARDQATNPVLRARWIEIGTATLFAFGLGLAAFFAVARLTRPARRRLEEAAPRGYWQRLGSLLLLCVLEAARLAAFAVVAYVMIGLLAQSLVARLLLISAVNAVVALGALRIVGRAAFAPHTPGLRVLPFGDETGAYLYLWLNRFIFLAIPAYFIANAAWLLGLPRAAAHGLLTVVELVIALLAIVFVLQVKKPVADAIRGRRRTGWAAVARARIGDVWHVVAMIYIVVLLGAAVLQIDGGFTFIFRATVATAATVLVASLAVFLLHRLIGRLSRIDPETARRHPGLERRANRYLPIMRNTASALVAVIAVLFILEAWSLGGLAWLADPLGRRIASALVSILFVLVLGVVVWEVVSNMIERALTQRDAEGNEIQASARQRTLLPLARNAFLVVLVTVLALIILSEVSLNIGPLLAGAGVIGLAVGFGAQKLVQDVITGFFILVEDTMQVGDVVNLGNGNSGLVEGITVRTVRLRDLTGTVHTVPFSQVSAVLNLTKDFSFYVFDIGVAYRENVNDVIEVVRQLGAELRADPDFGPVILEPIEIIGVDAFTDSAVVIKARFKTLPIKQWMVGREFNRRMKLRFDELGIEIPFPHMTLYFGEDRKGQAPAANLRVSAPELVETMAAAERTRTLPPAGQSAGQSPGQTSSRPSRKRRTPDQRGDDTPVSTPGQEG